MGTIPTDPPRNRFKKYVQNELKSFGDSNIAQRLWDGFRNGLAHEARLKNGGQFSLDIAVAVYNQPPILMVNPLLLLDEVSDALAQLVERLHKASSLRQNLLNQIQSDFACELQDHP
ncbi:MAG: hypothetical protein C4293_00075 [Nitrospiraceae bacterium]